MRRWLALIIVFGVIFGFVISAWAQASISDEEAEQRAREVGRSLRCVVCQNQSIDQSDATLAADMRALVRERIRAGDSNTDVMLYMRDRYGDYVLLKPPLQKNTLILWFGPFILLLALFIWYFMRAKKVIRDVDPLSAEERTLVDELIGNRKDNP